jgi:hypothetical protein
MKKRLMLILAIGVSFTSLSFADDSIGQNQVRSQIPVEAIDCGVMANKDLPASGTNSQGSGGAATATSALGN